MYSGCLTDTYHTVLRDVELKPWNQFLKSAHKFFHSLAADEFGRDSFVVITVSRDIYHDAVALLYLLDNVMERLA